jgi:hypothetical protein
MAWAVFFLCHALRVRRRLDRTPAANLGVDLYPSAAQLLKLPELGNLSFRLAPGRRAGQGFGDGLALHLVGEAEAGTMAGMTGLMTMTLGLAGAAGDAGDRPAAEVPELGNLQDQLGPLVLQGVEG